MNTIELKIESDHIFKSEDWVFECILKEYFTNKELSDQIDSFFDDYNKENNTNFLFQDIINIYSLKTHAIPVDVNIKKLKKAFKDFLKNTSIKFEYPNEWLKIKYETLEKLEFILTCTGGINISKVNNLNQSIWLFINSIQEKITTLIDDNILEILLQLNNQQIQQLLNRIYQKISPWTETKEEKIKIILLTNFFTYDISEKENVRKQIKRIYNWTTPKQDFFKNKVDYFRSITLENPEILENLDVHENITIKEKEDIVNPNFAWFSTEYQSVALKTLPVEENNTEKENWEKPQPWIPSPSKEKEVADSIEEKNSKTKLSPSLREFWIDTFNDNTICNSIHKLENLKWNENSPLKVFLNRLCNIIKENNISKWWRTNKSILAHYLSNENITITSNRSMIKDIYNHWKPFWLKAIRTRLELIKTLILKNYTLPKQQDKQEESNTETNINQKTEQETTSENNNKKSSPEKSEKILNPFFKEFWINTTSNESISHHISHLGFKKLKLFFKRIHNVIKIKKLDKWWDKELTVLANYLSLSNYDYLITLNTIKDIFSEKKYPSRHFYLQRIDLIKKLLFENQKNTMKLPSFIKSGNTSIYRNTHPLFKKCSDEEWKDFINDVNNWDFSISDLLKFKWNNKKQIWSTIKRKSWSSFGR